MVKVKLFSKAEIKRRKDLNEAQNVASVTSDIQQVQMQIAQAEQDYMKRVEPLKKKLIELQAQLSNIQGANAQQNAQQPGKLAQTGVATQQPQGGIQAAPSPATTV